MSKALTFTLLLGIALLASPLSGQTKLSLASSKWIMLGCDPTGDYCNYKPPLIKLSNDSNGDLVFTFPGPTTGTVNYLTTKFTQPLTGYSYIVFTLQSVDLSGTPTFDFNLQGGNDGPEPATARPYIQYVNDREDANYANKEWWADDPYSFQLTPFGTLTVQVPFNPANWSNEAGETGTSQLTWWNKVLAHPGQIGVTFGGGFFAGHGLTVENGTAQFKIVGVSLQ